MSKNFSVDINDLYMGATEVTEDKKELLNTIKKESKTSSKEVQKAPTRKGIKPIKKAPYYINIKIDEDNKDYFNKIEWIKIIDERTSTDKTQYINDLIRQDMIKRLKLKPNVKTDDLMQAWENYKETNNL